ncbi:hypothetical protein M404DRAFT_22583 [Pisolithus tinctorius Marx 270]|uniref:Zn(2)-C6 fungal-type domain-containing protein n=1 Tax=Pisolithus tinctorius Marx 270 TaxID=870435 RepID=A0A0C3PJF9_PISTI|nr:hypothetical protein M404DRAFT_22583 [Pisolithus tinctorius Marx 270]
MSANCAPRLSQLVCAATPDPVEVEKANLQQQIAAASAILVAEARCFPEDHEGMEEEKTMWLRCWEEKTAMLMPLVEHGKELGVTVRVDAAEVPILAEADDVYERWMAEEAEVCARAEQDVQMGDENAQETGGPGASIAVPAATEKMSHVEVVSCPVRKQSWQTITESKDEDEPKIVIPPGSILHKVLCAWCTVKKTACIRPVGWTCDGCARMKQGCEKSMKATGKKAQAGTLVARASKTVKASSSKRVVDDNDDDDEVEVVESHMHAKGKAPVHSRLDAKVTADLSQSLRLLHAEAAELQATYLRLQVRVDQLAEALEKIGVE